jgi:peptidyl-prolyl cis-trans isomerase A (cyclophilin A)
MTIRLTLAATVLLASHAALAQTPATQPPATPDCTVAPAIPPLSEQVRLTTSAGDIVVEVETQRAPITAANFLRYVDQRRFDGTGFYRAMRIGDGGLIQGGTRGDRARVRPPIAHEPTTTTCLSHTDMAISMARGAPGSADGDFFIIVGNQMTGLNANPAATGDNQGFAVFGRVVVGQDVVRTILGAPTSPTEGEGVMRGQMLSPAVRITTARRQPRPTGEQAASAPPR